MTTSTAWSQLVHLDCWDTMGHIIYPLRYMQKIPGHPVTLERYQDRLRALLTGVAQAGRAIEVNTWCGRTVTQWQPLLELYRDCGGELITLGPTPTGQRTWGRGSPRPRSCSGQSASVISPSTTAGPPNSSGCDRRIVEEERRRRISL